MLTNNSIVSDLFSSGVGSADLTAQQFLAATPLSGLGNFAEYVNGSWQDGTAYASRKAAMQSWCQTNNLTLVDATMLNTLGVTPDRNVFLTPGEMLLVIVYMHDNYSYTEVAGAGQEAVLREVARSANASSISLNVAGNPNWLDSLDDCELPAAPIKSLFSLDPEQLGHVTVRKSMVYGQTASTWSDEDVATAKVMCINGIESITALDDDDLRAYWLLATNPVATDSDHRRVARSAGPRACVIVERDNGTTNVYSTYHSAGQDPPGVDYNYLYTDEVLFLFVLVTDGDIQGKTTDVHYEVYWDAFAKQDDQIWRITASRIPVLIHTFDSDLSAVTEDVQLPGHVLINEWNSASTAGFAISLAYLINSVNQNMSFVEGWDNYPQLWVENTQLANHQLTYLAPTLGVRLASGIADQYVPASLAYNGVTTPRPDTFGVDDIAVTVPLDQCIYSSSSAISVSGDIVAPHDRAYVTRSYSALTATLSRHKCTSILYDTASASINATVVLRMVGATDLRATVVNKTWGNAIGYEYEDVQTTFSVAFFAAIGMSDTFNADVVMSHAITAELEAAAKSRYSIYDSYLEMYADFTANQIVSSVVDSFCYYLMAGSEVIPDMYGIGTDTEIEFYVNNAPYTTTYRRIYNASEGTTEADIALQLVKLSNKMAYRNRLFQEAHTAFADSEISIDDWRKKLNDEIARLYDYASSIGVNIRSSSGLLLNAAYQETILDDISTVLTVAYQGGARSVQDVMAIAAKVFAGTDLAYTLDGELGKSYRGILAASVYGGDFANVANTDIERASDVDYWRTFLARMGGAVTGEGASDPEFMTTGEGAAYLWPPIISSTAKVTGGFDQFVDASGVGYVPLRSSYVIIRKLSGNVYEVDWCARFNGGHDVDMINAMIACYDEFFSFCSDLMSIYDGNTISVDYQRMFTSDAKWNEDSISQDSVNQAIGAFGVAGSFALSGAAIGSVFPGIGTALGAAVGATAGAIVLTAEVLTEAFSPDPNGPTNANYTAAALIAGRDDLLNSISIAGGVFDGLTGRDAVNTMNAVLMWALKYGIVTPFGTPIATAAGRGVYSPSIIPPKYTYIGEHQDWSGWVAMLALVTTALFVRYWKGHEHTIDAAFIPGTIAGLAMDGITAAGQWVSKAFKAITDESRVMQIAKALGVDELEYDEEGNPITIYSLLTNANTMLNTMLGVGNDLRISTNQIETGISDVIENPNYGLQAIVKKINNKNKIPLKY